MNKSTTICPHCHSCNIVKNGFKLRKSDQHKAQQFKCKSCVSSFSDATFAAEYNQRLRDKNLSIAIHLAEGMGISKTSRVLGISKKTILKRMLWLGRYCMVKNKEYLEGFKTNQVQFDELITFEHTICKPIIVVAMYCSNTRLNLHIQASQIPPLPNLKYISMKKYGFRKSKKTAGLRTLFRETAKYLTNDVTIISDMDYTYPKQLERVYKKEFNINYQHRAYKSRKPKRYGHGELKVGPNDPLFIVNHGLARMRDSINRLQRTTWSTTKKQEYLEAHLSIFAWYYNTYLIKGR